MGIATTAGGESKTAAEVLKMRSEKSLEMFILTFVVVNLILAVRVQ